MVRDRQKGHEIREEIRQAELAELGSTRSSLQALNREVAHVHTARERAGKA